MAGAAAYTLVTIKVQHYGKLIEGRVLYGMRYLTYAATLTRRDDHCFLLSFVFCTPER